MSKQRPSGAVARPVTGLGANASIPVPTGHWRKRVFKNTYTRDGRCIEVKNWSVKIQHQGTRRTFSLAAGSRAAAAVEAQAIYQTIVTQGWDAAVSNARHHLRDRQSGDAATDAALPKTDIRYWTRRLIRRRHWSPRSPTPAGELSARVEHSGFGYYFPLGTSNEKQAAARALEIFLAAVRCGWEAVYQGWPREVTIALHWADNPLTWTYATFHTMTRADDPLATGGMTRAAATLDVVVIEPDVPIRRALSLCIGRQIGFTCRGSFANAADALAAITGHSVHLMVVNQSLPDVTAAALEEKLRRAAPDVPILFFSVYEDSDQLFKATPGGATGYLLKRTPPDRLFEPIAGVSQSKRLDREAIALQVRRYFQDVVEGLSAPDTSREMAKLTHREHEILNLLSKGYVDKEIAEALGISVWTVHGHLKKVFEKLGVHTRTEAAVKYLHK
jgi:DNA-binding NarL/FixJ family response regulator